MVRSVLCFVADGFALPWPIVSFLIMGLVGATVFLMRGQASLQAQIARVDTTVGQRLNNCNREGQIARVETNQAVIQERVQHLPTNEQFVELNRLMAEQTAAIKATNKILDQFERRLNLMQSYFEGDDS